MTYREEVDRGVPSVSAASLQENHMFCAQCFSRLLTQAKGGVLTFKWHCVPLVVDAQKTGVIGSSGAVGILVLDAPEQANDGLRWVSAPFALAAAATPVLPELAVRVCRGVGICRR